MTLRRLQVVVGVFLGWLLAASAAFAECGGTTQCIGVGPTIADAQVAHHGLGPATFTMDFGNQPATTSSASKTIFVEAVTGPAGSMVQLAPTTITDADASSFSISGGTCSPSNGPVNGGAGCTILVRFNPTSIGAKSATVHVNLAFPGCVGCITERVVTVVGNGTSAPLFAPSASDASFEVPYQTAGTINLANFVSGTYDTVSIASGPSHGTATLSGTVVTYTPAAGYIGSDSFTYTATGPGGTSPPATVFITVAKPGAPTASARAVSTPFETPVAIDLASSVTGVFSSIALVTQPQHGTTSVNGTVVTYTPARGFFGTDTFTFTATGPGGTSAPATVTITIETAPARASNASMTVQVNTPGTLDLAPFVSGSGISGVVIVTRPVHGTVIVSGLRATYTPAQDYFGADSFTYSAVGVTGTSPPATVSVTVVGRPDPTRNPNVTGLLAAQSAAAERFARTQIANVQGRMESLHRAEPAAERARTADSRPSEGFLRNSYASAGAELPFSSELASLLASGTLSVNGLARGATNFWASGTGRFGTRGTTGAMTGFEFTTTGLTAGVDRRFGDRLAAGIAAGYARERTAIGADGSTNRARGVSFVGYGSYQPTRDTFVDALAGYGSLDFSSRRFVTAMGEFTTADRDGRQAFASIAAGWEHRANGFLFSPYARIDYARDRIDPATETGAGVYALAYSRQSGSSTWGSLGLRAEVIRESDFGWTNPRARLEYRHAFRDDRRSTIAYADIPGTTYAYSSPGSENNAIVLGLGTEVILRSGLTAGIEYQLARASARDRDQGIRLYFSQDLDGRGTSSWLGGFAREASRPLDWQADGGFMYDDNVARAQREADKLSDYSFSANARKSTVFPLSGNTRAIVNVSLGGEKFRRYDGLSKATAGLEAEWQYRPSGRFGAPTFAAFVNGAVEAYESRLRDGTGYGAGVSIRQALTDRLSVFGALAHARRNAEGEVFEGRDNSARVNFDYQWEAKDTLYLSGEYRRGDVVGSGKAPEIGNAFPHVTDFGRVALDAEDDAFPGYDAYRFKGNTAIVTLGYNRSIGPRESLDFSWRRVETKPQGAWGVDTLYGTVILSRYVTNQIFLVYLLSF